MVYNFVNHVETQRNKQNGIDLNSNLILIHSEYFIVWIIRG